MANPEHVRLAREGREAIAQWRSQHPDERLDLFGANLSGANLSGANLSGANLSGANLSRADLFEANLSGANLSGANLSGANLSRADLFEANLSRADLFEANLSRADLSRADLFEANLSGANLSRANLSGANLSLANLSWANLSWANLSGANLSGANLSGANLSGANLSRADLFEANLSWANLSWANLSWANLSGANLSGANLTGADLSGADLSGAKCAITTFANCDLSQCRGLDLVAHLIPSSIGIDTIVRSRGGIPRAFLLGAGVPGEVLDALLPLVSGGKSYYRCFISYTSTDEEFATRLHGDLEARGVACWKYNEDAIPGRKVWANIDRAIQENEKMVTICSRASLQRDGVPKEIERALQKEADLKAENVRRKLEAERQGKAPDLLDEDVLVPVRLDDFALHGWQHGRRADVAATNILDFSEWQQDGAKYQNALRRLLHALDPATWGPA